MEAESPRRRGEDDAEIGLPVIKRALVSSIVRRTGKNAKASPPPLLPISVGDRV